jgi:Flp pilus assembly protein TadD
VGPMALHIFKAMGSRSASRSPVFAVYLVDCLRGVVGYTMVETGGGEDRVKRVEAAVRLENGEVLNLGGKGGMHALRRPAPACPLALTSHQPDQFSLSTTRISCCCSAPQAPQPCHLPWNPSTTCIQGSAHMQAWTNLGVLLREQCELDAARRTFQEALAHAPAHPIVLSNLSALYVLIGNRGGSGARAAYERALAYTPTNTDALYNIGVLEGSAERWETALFYYQTCVRLNPKHTLAWNNLGVVYQRVNNLACAIECYEAAVASKPDFGLSLNNLGVIYTTQGQSKRGSRHLRAAITAQPSYAEAHNNLGVLMRDMGLVREVLAPPATVCLFSMALPLALDTRNTTCSLCFRGTLQNLK